LEASNKVASIFSESDSGAGVVSVAGVVAGVVSVAGVVAGAGAGAGVFAGVDDSWLFGNTAELIRNIAENFSVTGLTPGADPDEAITEIETEYIPGLAVAGIVTFPL
jgi:predicted Rossmann fold nucleotide-binding protein DprA/Smf involved in DNA uptake